MLKPTGLDHQNTRQYIPSLSDYYPNPIKESFKNVETRFFHEGRWVYADYNDTHYLDSMFELVNLDCIYKINEQIVPKFVLEFYSVLNLTTDNKGEIYINFTIQIR